jgi:Flp pilus assembly protein TadD
MPRRPATRSRIRAKEQPAPSPSASPARPGRNHWKWMLTGLSILVALAAIARLYSGAPSRLRAEAERAERANDRAGALRAWRAFNATSAARGATHLAEARAALALGFAGQAERSLRRSVAADPANREAWKLLLEILRVEDRALEAQEVVWGSYDRVPRESRRDVLRELTLAILADVPDQSVRAALEHWINADPADVDARVALSQRIESQPLADDPDRQSRLAELESLVAEHPDHLGAREAFIAALADAGEPDRGRAALDGWPGPAEDRDRDPRYRRLRGRWDLEYDRRPAEAAAALRAAVQSLPQDWRSWSRLARALHQLGQDAEAHQAAEAVGRVREALEPIALGPRLDDDFRHLDDPRALRDLAALADQAGLSRLADAWRAEADNPAQAAHSSSP